MGAFNDDGWGLWVFLAVPIVLWLLVFLLGPLLTYASLRFPNDQDVIAFDPDDRRVPEEVAEHFAVVRSALERHGFDTVSGVALPQLTNDGKAMLILLVNRQTKTAAAATALYQEISGEVRLRSTFLALVNRFRDGSFIQTLNSGELLAFRPPPEHVTFPFPMVDDPARLLRLHEQLVDRHSPASPRTLRLDDEYRGDVEAYMSQDLYQEVETQIPVGRMRLSESDRAYRPTLWGAYVMTWGQLWPMSAIRRAKRDAKARRLLAELEA